MTQGIFIITLLLNLPGIFSGKALTMAAIQGIAFQMIPLIACLIFGPGKRWMMSIYAWSTELQIKSREENNNGS